MSRLEIRAGEINRVLGKHPEYTGVQSHTVNSDGLCLGKGGTDVPIPRGTALARLVHNEDTLPRIMAITEDGRLEDIFPECPEDQEEKHTLHKLLDTMQYVIVRQNDGAVCVVPSGAEVHTEHEVACARATAVGNPPPDRLGMHDRYFVGGTKPVFVSSSLVPEAADCNRSDPVVPPSEELPSTVNCRCTVVPPVTHAFPLLVKPHSDFCRLDCTYCFYKGTQEEKRMSYLQMHTLINAYRRASVQEDYTWQGGEPTEMGAAFFIRAMQLQGDGATNSLQTNGVLFANEEKFVSHGWAGLLASVKGGWTVGLSHDGPTNESRGVATSVLDRAAYNLLRYKIPFSFLCVVSEENAGNAKGVMEHFNQRGFTDVPIQFICAKGTKVTGAAFGAFLAVALLHSKDHGQRIANFRAADAAWHGDHMICETLEQCGNYIAVEVTSDAELTLYPCDFFVHHTWALGSIKLGRTDAANAGALIAAYTGVPDPASADPRPVAMEAFRGLKTLEHKACTKCNVRKACNMGCPADRKPANSLTSMCAAHKVTGHVTDPTQQRK